MTVGQYTRRSKPGDDFGTPENVCDLLYELWDGIPDLDPCTGPTAIFQAKEMWSVGGLQRQWFNERRRTAFVNMPYSRLAPWMRKCFVEAHSAECPSMPELIALPPASTSAGWWKEYASTADAVVFTKRLNFIGSATGGLQSGNARFHSALIYFGPRPARFGRVMEPITTWFAKSA